MWAFWTPLSICCTCSQNHAYAKISEIIVASKLFVCVVCDVKQWFLCSPCWMLELAAGASLGVVLREGVVLAVIEQHNQWKSCIIHIVSKRMLLLFLVGSWMFIYYLNMLEILKLWVFLFLNYLFGWAAKECSKCHEYLSITFCAFA